MDKKLKKKRGGSHTKRIVMVRVDADTHRQLRVLAGRLGLNNSELVTRAIALLDVQEGSAS